MARMYRGKYPNRVNTIYGAVVNDQRVMKIELNDGRRFVIRPIQGMGNMLPKLGDELETVMKSNTVTEG